MLHRSFEDERIGAGGEQGAGTAVGQPGNAQALLERMAERAAPSGAEIACLGRPQRRLASAAALSEPQAVPREPQKRLGNRRQTGRILVWHVR